MSDELKRLERLLSQRPDREYSLHKAATDAYRLAKEALEQVSDMRRELNSILERIGDLEECSKEDQLRRNAYRR